MDACCLLVTVVQVLGLIAAFAARVSENSSRHVACLFLFLTALLGVGLAAMLFIRLPSGIGILSGFTLGIMIVATTWDGASPPRTADS